MRGPCLVFAHGYNHPFAETGAALAAIAADLGWPTRIETDLDRAIAALGATHLLIVNTLLWSMTQHEKYAPDRARWAYALPDGHLAALAGFVEGGGRLLALHTSVIAFDNQPGWRDLLGGGWRWGRSHHPPLGPVTLALTEAGRRSSTGAGAFDLVDEVYHDLDPAPDVTVWAEGRAGAAAQPVAWTKRHARGRVAVDALGHDARSLATPGHRALLDGLVGWLGDDA